MIILMSQDQMVKKVKKIVKMKGVDNMIIVNATNSPQFRDMPNVLTEIDTVDENGVSSRSSISALSFQMPVTLFEEPDGSARRDQMLERFFTNRAFKEMFMMILAKQLSNSALNIFVCIENNSYEKYADEYLHEFGRIMGINDAEGVVYLWQDIGIMEEYLTAQLKHMLKDDIDDDEADDIDMLLEELKTADDNKTVRKLFIKHAVLFGALRKKCANVVKRYYEENSDTIGDTTSSIVKDAMKKEKKHKEKKHKEKHFNSYDEYEEDYNRRHIEDADDNDDDHDDYDGSFAAWAKRMKW